MKRKQQTTLHKIYNNPSDPGSFGGVERLYQSARAKGLKLDRKKVEKYLKSDDTYTLHKPSRKHYTRNMIVVSDIDKQWQADLADMQEIAKENDGYRYLLTVIDCFSKYAWIVPLKKKDTLTTLEGFKTLFQQTTRKPERLQTDKGTEFMNKEVQNFFKSKNIHHFFSNSDMKAAMVERFNRTIKSRIFAYMTSVNTKRYIDKLQNFVDSYNHSTHRTIGMKPADVKLEHVAKIFSKVYGKFLAKRSLHKVDENEHVRLNKIKTTFEKGYLPNWTTERFVVDKNLPQQGKPVYKLKDLQGDEIQGRFYPEEIQVVTNSNPNVFRIEKILKTRTTKRGKEFLVKWIGYPAKLNRWLKESELRHE